MMIKSILLSVDGSIYTEAVLRNGIHLARALQARLRVLSIIDVRTFEWAMSLGADGFVPVIPSNAYLEESRKLHEEKAAAVLKKSQEILSQEKVPFELEKASGAPADV
ncbi:MAG: universal stress protein, partial [Calditrichaeota bacterium]